MSLYCWCSNTSQTPTKTKRVSQLGEKPADALQEGFWTGTGEPVLLMSPDVAIFQMTHCYAHLQYLDGQNLICSGCVFLPNMLIYLVHTNMLLFSISTYNCWTQHGHLDRNEACSDLIPTCSDVRHTWATTISQDQGGSSLAQLITDWRWMGGSWLLSELTAHWFRCWFNNNMISWNCAGRTDIFLILMY